MIETAVLIVGDVGDGPDASWKYYLGQQTVQHADGTLQ